MKQPIKIGLLIVAISAWSLGVYSQNLPKISAKKMVLNQQNSQAIYEAEESIESSQIVDNEQVIKQKAGKIITLQAGFHAREGSIFTAEIVELSIQPSPKTFVPENAVLIYPNPSKGVAKLSLNPDWASTQGKMLAKVFNQQGEIIFTQELSNQADIKLDISGQKKGVYLLKLYAQDEEICTKRLILD
jgi:hypothetical protein